MIATSYQDKVLKDTFPNLQRFLNFRMPLTPVDDLRVWKIFLKHSQLSPQTGRQAVSWGNKHKPYLEVNNLPKGVYGKFDPASPDTVVIATCVAEKFNADFKDLSKRPKALFYMRAIILHELVHWGDWNADGVQSDKGKPHDEDAGRCFELEAYYKKIYPKEWIGDY
jgi:hypothetical protein